MQFLMMTATFYPSEFKKFSFNNLTLKIIRPSDILVIAITMVLGATNISCRMDEPALTILGSDSPPPQVSLVSVQSVSNSQAEILVKATQSMTSKSWEITAQNLGGQTVSLTKGEEQTVGAFTLTILRASGLAANQTYRFVLRFKFNNQDSVTALRYYTHRTNGPTWQRLAHAPLDGGDYTGYPVADKFSNILIGRYAGSNLMQAWYYNPPFDRWQQISASLLKIQPRRGLIQFNLFFHGDLHYFYGLGYAVNEQASSNLFYYHDLWTIIGSYDGIVVPQYEGEDGEVAFFITTDEVTKTDEAYFLTQNGSPATRSINANFPQVPRASLPEAPGTLATFTVNNIGYVVNQRPGQPIHLWAYNPQSDRWQQRADFPGIERNRGAGFAVGGQGYYGLGAAVVDQRGLRDLWRYDPGKDRWQYVTDYPGQGNRYLAVLNAPDQVYIGWGYESQSTATSVIRQVACTDWWAFKPN